MQDMTIPEKLSLFYLTGSHFAFPHMQKDKLNDLPTVITKTVENNC